MRLKKKHGQAGNALQPAEAAGTQIARTVEEKGIMREKEPSSGFGHAETSEGTVLSSDAEFKGSLSFKNFLRIDGKFEGDITSPGKIHVGESGELKGEVSVGNAAVEGKINGNVTAGGKVELLANAHLFGDVKASRLVIDEGVTFVGKCDVNPSASKIEALRPEPEPAADKEEQPDKASAGTGQ